MRGRTLVDSGPLVALFDKGDQHHRQALDFLSSFTGELLATTPVLTEVCYLLDFNVAAQVDFIRWVSEGALTLVELDRKDLLRIAELAQKYADLPMDFADASLVAIGERLEIRQIATIDTDFHLYRMQGKTAFRNIFFS
ncbi:MAG: PIN domain-containing protein [Candidatus Latescibacteria bacterium]|nr:PIN domain-containing protein [Candidatus Latescibacterota bacterium]